jgi:DHA3 family macrolide efflux protein-like MFS transporter
VITPKTDKVRTAPNQVDPIVEAAKPAISLKPQLTTGCHAAKATSTAPIYHLAKVTDTAEILTVASGLNGPTLRALLKNRNFVPLWIGQMVSYMGDQFMLIAALAVVSKLAASSSGIVTAGLGLSNALPSILLGLLGGVLVDRLDRKTVMIVSDIVRGLALFSLLLVNNDPAHLWIFFVVLAVTGAASTLFYPARASALPAIVPHQMLAGANALLEAGFVIALVFGALMAGLLVQLFGPNLAFSFNAVAYLFSAVMIGLLRIPQHAIQPSADGSARQVWHELREGLWFIWCTRSMRYIMLMSVMISASIGAVLLLSLDYLTKQLRVGPSQYGMVIAILGIGIVIGGVLIQRLSRYLPTNRLVAAAIALNGLSMLGFVFHPAFVVVCILTALIGFSIVVARAVLGTLTQAIPPEALRGRVQAAFNIISSVPLALSVGVVGLLLQLVSVYATLLPPGLPGLPQTLNFINSSSRQWIVFTGFAITMLLTAWLAIKILKDIDKAFSNSSEQKSASV